MVLQSRDVWLKLQQVELGLEQALSSPESLIVPDLPGRDIEFLPINLLPKKIKISEREGQQKLLHDLANIELQAMELGFRTLIEFSWAPQDFREELGKIILEEAKHLKMCLEGIESLGGYWGKWPIHMGLWAATHKKDSLLERIFIVHRYLEGSGLDAGDTILRRLSGVQSPIVKQAVKVIVDEEVGHVHFGSHWFKKICSEMKVDDLQFFSTIIYKLMKRHPRRDKLSTTLRKEAGFTDQELESLNEMRAKV